MTALTKYDRLESGGIWKSGPDAQRRDVMVSFGNATLVINDSVGRPLSHWSLPAITRLNEGKRPAIFAADDDAIETLEVDDALMIEAIETVRKTIANARPGSGKLRSITTAAVIAALAGLAIFWAPNALRNQTLSVVPQVKRTEIGATILGHLQAQWGQRCNTRAGRLALSQLQTRLLGANNAGQIVVLPRGLKSSLALPGNIIVLDQDTVEKFDDPAVTAGYVLSALARKNHADPLGPVLDTAGLRATLNLLTTGDLPPESLKAYAQALVDTPPVGPDLPDLLDTFGAAQVSTVPFGKAVGIQLEDDGRPKPPILTDGSWVALRGICDS